jgi:hypothetical protein
VILSWEAANITNDNSTRQNLHIAMSGSPKATNDDTQSRLIRIYAGFSLQKSGFDPRSVNVRSVIEHCVSAYASFYPRR